MVGPPSSWSQATRGSAGMTGVTNIALFSFIATDSGQQAAIVQGARCF